MRYALLCFFAISYAFGMPTLLAGNGEVSGVVRDEKGGTMPLVSIYVKGSTEGTTTNNYGEYTLRLPTGEYDVVFQFIGYEARLERVVISPRPFHLDVRLTPQPYTLGEVVVRSNAEDPAYKYIREAIRNRKKHLTERDDYACDVYIKGNQKVQRAPKKILGTSLGDLGGGLDSTRSGIIYLSESVSKLYYRHPETYKEVMVSSKVAGNDNGFSFNQARAMDFSFYKNELDFQNKLVSPIADDALAYYRYELVHTFVDKDGRNVAKIRVKPRNLYGPTFGGYIYLTEQEGYVYSTELYATGKAIGFEALDTLTIAQTHVPKHGGFLLFSQSIGFSLKLLGFRSHGIFTGVFTNYELNPKFPDGFFTNEVLKVETGANEKPKRYWDSIRPIPLTFEEAHNYSFKDSIKIIRATKEYKDSIDHITNKFALLNLLSDYTYRNSYRRWAFTIASPINALQFNTVQGWNSALDISYRKRYDDYYIRWWRVGAAASYGFAEQVPRVSANFTYHFNRIDNNELTVRGGQEVAQFNGDKPISPALNSSYTLLVKQNYMKLYEKTFVQVAYQQEVFNGVYINGSAEAAPHVANLANHSTQTYDRRNPADYTPNTPDALNAVDAAFATHASYRVDATARIVFDQKYILYPSRKITEESPYPTLSVHYTAAVPFSATDASYQLVKLQVQHTQAFGVFGTTEANIQAGTFLTSERVYFDNYVHFNGNQTLFGSYRRYTEGFKLLPYYTQSIGTGNYVEAHIEHDFGTYFLNKIPLLKVLGFSTVVGAHYLHTNQQPEYYELNVGVGKIGWGVIRLLRLDFVSAYQNGTFRQGFVIGLGL